MFSGDLVYLVTKRADFIGVCGWFYLIEGKIPDFGVFLGPQSYLLKVFDKLVLRGLFFYSVFSDRLRSNEATG
ncbi:hypothetical protein D9M73_230130 [compost metagenome]